MAYVSWGSVLIAVAIAIAATALGVIQVHLPYPATGYRIEAPRASSFADLSQRPATGALTPNRLLWNGRRLFEDEVVGCETVVQHSNGTLFMLDKFARLHLADPNSAEGTWELRRVSPRDTALGLPLGAQFAPDGSLVIADAVKGLARITPEGATQLLSSRVSLTSKLDPGSDLHYVDDVALHPNGSVFFTSCTLFPALRTREGSWSLMMANWMSLAHGHPLGRVLRYDPDTGETHVVLKGLWFANGILLSADASYLLVAETYAYRVSRLWLTGKQAGKLETFIDHLPGFVDNVSPASGGGYWVVLYGLHQPVMNYLPQPWARIALAYLPLWARPTPQNAGYIVKVSEQGKVLGTLQDPKGSRFYQLTSATEIDGKLLLGTLHMPYVGVLDLKGVAAALAEQEAAQKFAEDAHFEARDADDDD